MKNAIVQVFWGLLLIAGFVLVYLVVKMGEKR